MPAINAQYLRGLIHWTLRQIDMHSPAAEELLLGTAAHESHLGKYLRQINGPARGVYQMEPWVEQDIWENYLSYRPARIQRIIDITGINSPDHNHLQYNPVYATIMARLHYRRISTPLPPANDLEQLAHYWKAHYNTAAGRGTPDQFITDYRRLA